MYIHLKVLFGESLGGDTEKGSRLNKIQADTPLYSPKCLQNTVPARYE